ncbi:MAG TPA: Tsi3 family protein [Nostocaceae cyanobacterium]|nr:Tsi3 family protein [Nostocaceae cyanobacterium]
MLDIKRIISLVTICITAIYLINILPMDSMDISIFFWKIGAINEPISRRERQHPNGLSVNIPDNFFVKFQHDEGFYLLSLNPKPRVASGVTVYLIKNKSQPDLQPQAFRIINGETIYYSVEELTEGSGGKETHFHAWKNYPNSYIYVSQAYQQEEFGSYNPDFQVGWSLIASAKIKSAK